MFLRSKWGWVTQKAFQNFTWLLIPDAEYFCHNIVYYIHSVELRPIVEQNIEQLFWLLRGVCTNRHFYLFCSVIKAVNEQYVQITGDKDAHITKGETTIHEHEKQILQLSEALTWCVFVPIWPCIGVSSFSKVSCWPIFLASTLSSAEKEHLAMKTTCEELTEKLSTVEADKQSQWLKMTAEIDDLNRTKMNFEERLIELLRYDSLWALSAVSRPLATTALLFLDEKRSGIFSFYVY